MLRNCIGKWFGRRKQKIQKSQNSYISISGCYRSCFCTLSLSLSWSKTRNFLLQLLLQSWLSYFRYQSRQNGPKTVSSSSPRATTPDNAVRTSNVDTVCYIPRDISFFLDLSAILLFSVVRQSRAQCRFKSQTLPLTSDKSWFVILYFSCYSDCNEHERSAWWCNELPWRCLQCVWMQ